MKMNDLAGHTCGEPAAGDRCDATLPDNPECALNYHFGLLLGVDDLRAEQGFHLGQHRRHQRLLHGSGVVAGYGVAFDPATLEVRVEPGLAVDALGRDVALDAAQCVSIVKWWQAHREEPAFADVANRDDAVVDLEVVACYGACLSDPVPAIAAPCAGDSADIAFARACEKARLSLRRAGVAAAAEPAAAPYELLQFWLGRLPLRRDSDGKVVASEQWLLDQTEALRTLPIAQQAEARRMLERELIARAVAGQSPLAAKPSEDEPDRFCLPLARLRNVHIALGAAGWTTTVDAIDLGVRECLLPTSLLQLLALADPPAAPPTAGPALARGGATYSAGVLTLVFDRPLAAGSVTAAAFDASEFIVASGWQAFTLGVPAYDITDPTRPTVRLALDRTPVGERVRVGIVGNGPAPLLGADLVPAGALRAEDDGRFVSFIASKS